MPWDKITEGRWSGGPWLPSTTEEPETTLYVQRVLAAGGSIINRALIDLAIKTAKYDGYYDSVVAQFLPNAGIKKDSVTTLAAWTGTITLLDESAAVADPSVALTPSKWVTIADGAGGLVRGVVGVDGVSIYDSTELLTRGWETKVGSLNVSAESFTVYVSDFGGIYNNAVLALYDIGPLGNDVLGGTGIATAANPIWTPNMENQKAGIVFNAANSTVLRSAAFAQEVPQPNTIFFAGTNTADSSSSRCFFTALGTRQDLYVLPPTSLYAGGADFVRGTTPISILVINAVLFNGASSKLWVNGIVDVSGDPGSNALNGITLGANADANGSFLSGPIYEYISLSGDKTELVSTITDSIDSRLGVMESNYTFTPSIIGTFSDTGFLYDMAISGDNLYLLFQSGYLRVIDISDVENPVKIGELAGLMVGANRLSIEGTNAYITCGSVGLNEQLRIVDISDPEDPTIIGGSDFTLGFGIGITSHRVRNGLLYATLTSGAGMNAFRIIDVFDPADIHVAGGESLDIGPLPLGYPQGLDVVFPYAYVTIEDNNDNSFRIIDITDPAAPVVLSTTVDGDMVEARSPLVIGNYCYTLSASYIFGFTVFDVSNKAAPRIRRRIPLDNIAYLPNGLRSIGDGKVIMGSEIREGHLDAFRIVDVSSIYDLKMYTPDVLAYDNGMPSAVAKGNYVFLGFVNGVVQVMDLAASGF